MIKTISVVGLGYIGLPTAAIFASRRFKVIGVDVNKGAVDTINQGKVHIIEPDLDMLVQAAVAAGHLKAVTAPEPADAFLIAVPTPFKGDHEPDLRYIEEVSQSLAPVLKSGDLVILESTSPVGTTEQLANWLAAARTDLTFPQTHGDASDVRIAYCPERVLPGHVVRELVQNDRVIGGLSARCSKEAAELYKSFVEGECVLTNARTAEMCKLTENSFRDVNIAFANELSIICDNLDIDVWELIRLANRHPRVNILQPGPGVGGHCIAVDPWFIVSKSPEQARLIRTAREVNDGKTDWVIHKIRDAVASVEEPVVACLGLSFKPNIDDLRESPALEIALAVCGKNWSEVLLVEPFIEHLPGTFDDHANASLVSADEALKRANVIVLLVDHAQFNDLKVPLTRHPLVIDTRGMLAR
ncbi:UDP-N-acetyl-D-mannosamine dehydrogenase [Pelagibacterium sp.]|uniref:UDP-N-acetyl-D-mannosamine dehydrogenase n=1 Tax=Pelagibacterium sp. TaxID=1967288 RepID=UPI003A913DE5